MSYRPYSATRNSEGYLDMTAYLATRNIEREAREAQRQQRIACKPICRVWRDSSLQNMTVR